MAKRFSLRNLIKLQDVFQGSKWLLLRWYQRNNYSDFQLIYCIRDPNQEMKKWTGSFSLFLSGESFLLYLLVSVWPVAFRITQSFPLFLLGFFLCLSYLQAGIVSSVHIEVSLEEICNLQLIVEVGHKELNLDLYCRLSACQKPAWSGVTWITRKFSLPKMEKNQNLTYVK